MLHKRVLALPGTLEAETTYYVKGEDGSSDIYVVGIDSSVVRFNASGSGDDPVEIADVTGLQAALDGKAETVHAHAIADVTGLQTALDGKEVSGTAASLLSAAIGTTVQAWHATLDALAAVTTTVFGRSLLEVADRTELSDLAAPDPRRWYVGRDPNQGWQTHQGTTGLLSAAEALFVAVVVGKAGNYDRLTCYCQVAAAGATLRAALYAKAADNGPGVLLADFGTATLDTTGYKTLQLAAPIWLEPGIYWIVHQASSATPTFRGDGSVQSYGGGSVGGLIVSNAATGRVPYLTYATSLPDDMSAFTIGGAVNQLQFLGGWPAINFLLR